MNHIGAGDYVFQFQNGAIKSSSEQFSPVDQSRFQFQNGAIKRSNCLGVVISVPTFQFQNGAIKSIFAQLPLMII